MMKAVVHAKGGSARGENFNLLVAASAPNLLVQN